MIVNYSTYKSEVFFKMLLTLSASFTDAINKVQNSLDYTTTLMLLLHEGLRILKETSCSSPSFHEYLIIQTIASSSSNNDVRGTEVQYSELRVWVSIKTTSNQH